MALTQVNEFGFSGYEHHWWAYNGSQGLSADSADVLNSFTTLHNVSSTYHNYYKQLGNNALEYSKNFGWDKIIKRYIELL